MSTGTVKWFSAERGFGFIRRDEDGRSVFVPADAASPSPLHEGQRVRFDVFASPTLGATFLARIDELLAPEEVLVVEEIVRNELARGDRSSLAMCDAVSTRLEPPLGSMKAALVTRVLREVLGGGDNPSGEAGVREPRRPLPESGEGFAMVDPEDEDEELDAVGGGSD